MTSRTLSREEFTKKLEAMRPKMLGYIKKLMYGWQCATVHESALQKAYAKLYTKYSRVRTDTVEKLVVATCYWSARDELGLHKRRYRGEFSLRGEISDDIRDRGHSTRYYVEESLMFERLEACLRKYARTEASLQTYMDIVLDRYHNMSPEYTIDRLGISMQAYCVRLDRIKHATKLCLGRGGS